MKLLNAVVKVGIIEMESDESTVERKKLENEESHSCCIIYLHNSGANLEYTTARHSNQNRNDSEVCF